MHIVVVRTIRHPHGRRCTALCARALATQAEYVEVPKYPPIINLPEEQLQKDKWHAKITSLPTFEQKIMEINMPKGYGHYSCILKDDEFQINGLPFLKYVTRTNVSEDFPYSYYDDVSQAATVAAARLVPDVERLILLHHHHAMSRNANCESTSQQMEASFISGLHRLLSSCLPFPLQTQVSHNPRVLAGWFVGGLDNVGADRQEWKHFSKEEREKKLWVRNLWLDREEPYMGDRIMRSFSTPSLVVRERHGLPQVQSQHAEPPAAVSVPAVASDAGDVQSQVVDDGRRDPEAYGYEQKHMPFMMNPGYWPGESCRHGRVFYHSLQQVSALPWAHHRHSFLLQKLLISCHTQALSQAAIFGFSPFSELTYPVVQQSLVTDGQLYYTVLHQLNTVALSGDNAFCNPCTNCLWVSRPERLWEGVREGTVRGLNLQLLSQLTAMYMKNCLPNPDPSPYLADYKYLWNHPAIPWYRRLFHKRVGTFKSERFWIDLKPELMSWEKIYKLDFNTMIHMNNGKRFFEGHRFRLLPQDRTCRHTRPPSIKVADRPLGKKDPIKREPMIDSEKLFDRRVKSWSNWRYHRSYTYRVKP